jgi:hypothetical protein
MIEYLEKGGEVIAPQEPQERVIPLTIDPSFFRGKKPVAILFGDERITVKSWRGVLKTILSHCNQTTEHHERLMYLRGKVAGRDRVFLSASSDGMTHSIKIDEGLYTEGHFGSEGMMHVLVQRILKHTGYDYSNICIILKS